jgi:hypothetical protein
VRCLAADVAFDEVVLNAVPETQRMFGIFGVEAHELLDAGAPVAFELGRPVTIGGVRRAHDLDGDVRSAAFPNLPAGNRRIRSA